MVKLIIGTIGIKRLQGRVSIVPAAAGAGGGKMQEKTVAPKTTRQTVTPDGGFSGLSRVTVEAVTLQDKIVAPGTGGQVVQADDGSLALGTVTVQGAPLQSKAVTPGAEAQTVEPDPGFYGLASVEVDAAEIVKRATAVSYSRSGNTITETSTLEDGTTAASEITLDENGVPVSVSGGGETIEIEITYGANGYPTTVTIDGEECPVGWEGFE